MVKADGYGHGAIAVGQAALAAGAAWLGVALVEEGAVLRRAGIEAPILLLSQPRPADVDAAVRLGLRLSRLHRARASTRSPTRPAASGAVAPVHLKVNTGMNRVGAAPAEVAGLARRSSTGTGLELEALWTHCAVADEPGNPFTDEQLDRFDDVLGRAGPTWASARRCATRPTRPPPSTTPAAATTWCACGIGVYGLAPAPGLADRVACARP